MDKKKCFICGKTPLTKDEIGLTKKLIDKKAHYFYCINCLAEYLEVTPEELEAKVEEFKDDSNEEFNLEKFKNLIRDEFNKNKEKLEINEKMISEEYNKLSLNTLVLKEFDFEKFKDGVIEAINLEKNELIKDQTIQEEKNKQLLEGKTKLKEYNEEYSKELLNLGFKTEEEYKNVLIADKEIENLQKYVEQFNTNVTVNNTKIFEIEKEVKDKQKLDLTESKAKLIKAKNELEEERKVHIQAKGKLDNNTRIYNLLTENSKELKKKMKDFLIYDELNRTANGTLPGKKRIEFEQYVQATYFDMVILEANKRLAKMTENRYWLVRKEEPEKISDKVGLDLEVVDNYNGKKRDVKSLSGGEAFKAALSLALGLSDVIQSYSGGVVIDTLFIDEGFGSLDTESREQAINTLSLLIDNNKLIGIISHVTELKERIDKKIIVTKTNDGSKIEIEA